MTEKITDKTEALAAVKDSYGDALEYASDELQNDPEILDGLEDPTFL